MNDIADKPPICVRCKLPIEEPVGAGGRNGVTHLTDKHCIILLKEQRNELAAVLGLLRLHRTGPDWEQPIPSDLLSREDASLAKLEEKRA